ncbi:cell wall metabolism sensor histidine kinase WalK [Allofustis seminis]|uniref:cell wall metabolism sensor histidine kinase WalK n=1 Tax=Allofustis seminis TaxID=166939 RepID=UPI00037B6407|nr:cell wall metabolism sensor histidine kinase WalK [Allofustis seminis]
MIKRIMGSIKMKITVVIVLTFMFALQLIGANFITQTEKKLIGTFQSDRQMQMDFLKNSLSPILEEHTQEKKLPAHELTAQEEINQLLLDFSGSGITEVFVVDRNFVILGTSDNIQESTVGKISNDQDLRKSVIQGQQTAKQVIDQQLNARRWKIVSPVETKKQPGEIIGAIVMESDIETVYTQVSEITWMFLSSSFIAIILSGILANFVSSALTEPIKEMQLQTKKIADGNYSGEVTVYGHDDLSVLGMLINDLSNEVESAQKSVDAERRRLDSVLSNMTDGVIATNRRGKVVVANAMAAQLLNVERADLLDHDILDVLELNDQLELKDLFKQKRDVLIRRKTARGTVSLRISFALIQSNRGIINGTVCVLHDVTEQEQIEAERKEFVSNVSHELRTPLTSMRSYIEALIDGAWKDEELAPKFLEVAQSETDRMIRMIQDLLHLSRIDSGRSELDLEIIDMNQMLTQIIQRFRILLDSEEYKGKNYQIKEEIVDEIVFAEIDLDRMTQVIDNIINNAIKYSPDGGTITVRMETMNQHVLMSIQDEGMGIPAEDLDKIFTRFYRVDRARSRAMGGTGLGLAISKEVIAQHGGQIWAKSIEEKGTTVYIDLPYIPFEDEEW